MSARNKALSPLDKQVINLREAADHDERYAAGLEADVARFTELAQRNAALNPRWADRCRIDAALNRKSIEHYLAQAVAKRAEAALLLAGQAVAA